MTLLTTYLVVALLAGAVALWLPVQLPAAPWLLALAALPQLLALVGVRHAGLALLSLTLCCAWGWRNRRLPGVALVILGLGLNLAVMALHGGAMPITIDRLADLGSSAAHGTALIGSKDVAVASSPIWWLGDWMTFQHPPYSLTASPGDLIVVIGLARWLIAAQRTRRLPDDLASPRPMGA